ncbi:MAG: biotin transporter BioY [Dehalococcoidia bacterium]
MSTGTLRYTLTDAVLPRETVARQALLIVGAVAFLALAAQVSWNYPFIQTRAGGPVPITGQTFGVLVIGALLGSRLGGTAILAYLTAGVAGFPIFAGWSGSYTHFAGPTGGYLLGLVIAAMVVGWFAERGWDRSRWIVLPMLLGNALIYVPGLLWLHQWQRVVGLEGQTLDMGLWPFVPGDLLKLVAAALVLPAGWTLAERLGAPLRR